MANIRMDGLSSTGYMVKWNTFTVEFPPLTFLAWLLLGIIVILNTVNNRRLFLLLH